MISKVTARNLVSTAALALTLNLNPWGASAHAATITVNSTADAADAVPGDGVCATVAGPCTLRAAIQEANALAGADTIGLPAGTYTLTVEGRGEDAGANGDLDISGDVQISGAGSAATIVDGNGIDRVFQIAAKATVAVSGVTVRNGSTDYNATGSGAGVDNAGTLLLSDVAIVGNKAYDGSGAGLNNRGTATLTDVTVTGNEAYLTRRGAANGKLDTVVGGGIANFGNLTVRDVTLSANQAVRGGGIYNHGASDVRNASVTSNRAYHYEGIGVGAGIYNDAGTVKVQGSVLADNAGRGNPAPANCFGTIVSPGLNQERAGNTCGF